MLLMDLLYVPSYVAKLSSDLLHNCDSFDCTIIKIHLSLAQNAGTKLEIDTLSFTVYFGFASSIKTKSLRL